MSEIDNELTLEDLIRNVEVCDKNLYISDENKAIELFSSFFGFSNTIRSNQKALFEIQNKIDEIFSLISEVGLKNELIHYEAFEKHYKKLKEIQKIRAIKSKTIISLGGKFSSGKSKFINSITGLVDTLPESQSPTTSIPTYIMSGEKYSVIANSIFGNSKTLTNEELKALTHEFYTSYQIGFSSFVDSILIKTPAYKLKENIAILDTPGYTKYDGELANKLFVSDRKKAFEQLKTTDYLIWLVDIDNGTLTRDDIEFIDSLSVNRPILIIFNKADQKPTEEICKIIYEAKKIVNKNLNTKCFGITAYSSTEGKEYGDNLIDDFLKMVAHSQINSNDILEEFLWLEHNLEELLQNEKQVADELSDEIFNIILHTKNTLEIKSLSDSWSKYKQLSYRIYMVLSKYKQLCCQLNEMIHDFIEFRENRL